MESICTPRCFRHREETTVLCKCLLESVGGLGGKGVSGWKEKNKPRDERSESRGSGKRPDPRDSLRSSRGLQMDARLLDHRENIILGHDQQVFAVDIHLVAGVRRKQHAIAFLNLE